MHTKAQACMLLALASGSVLGCGASEPAYVPVEVSISADQDPEVRAAVQAARDALLAAPGELALSREFAMVLDANGLDPSAQEAWQRVTELAPDDASAWYQLSKVSERNGDGALSLSAVRHSVELDSKYAPSQARLGRLMAEHGEPEAAERAFRESVRLDPRSARGPLGLARLMLARGDAQAAIDQLEPLLTRNPREPHANGLLARAWVQRGQPERAEAYLAAEEQAGAASGSDPWGAEVRRRATGKFTRINRAKSALARGDAKAALEQLQPLWDRRLEEQAVLESLCEVRMALGQPKQVLALLDEAAPVFEESYSRKLFRARAERAMGHDELALKAAQAAAALNTRRAEAAAFSGQLFFDLQRFQEAVQALARAREQGDTSLQTLAYLGRARACAGDLEGALADLRRATESYPTIPKPWAYLAEVLAMDGQANQAAEALAEAAALGLAPALVESTQAKLRELKSKVH